MTSIPPLPRDIWGAMPTEVRAHIEALFSQVQALQAEVAALRAQLGLNSSNSSKPPSTDPSHVKRQPPQPPSKRKRGGQPGHKRAVRPMVPPDQLAQVVECVPEVCSCGTALAGTDPAPHPHQVAELPEIRPDIVEYRLHRLVCPTCKKVTRATLPPGVPTGAFGPRLLATIALLTGRYRLSKRLTQAALLDLLGLSVSTGMVSKAERRAEAATAGPDGPGYRHLPGPERDETGWCEARRRGWLWTAVGAGMTLFRIDRTRGADALRRLVGEAIAPVITSDRFPTYKRVPVRQVCWAHLRRDFQAMIDRAAGGQEVGAKLLALSGRVFDGWRKFSAGVIRRTTLRGQVGWIRPVVRLNLEAGRPVPVDGQGVPSAPGHRGVALDVRAGRGRSPGQ